MAPTTPAAAPEPMSPKHAKMLAKIIEEAIVRRYGKDWRRFMVPEIQKAIVSQEVLHTVLSWRTTPFTHADIVVVFRAAMDRIMPEPEVES